MEHAVYALYPGRLEAEDAAQRLREAGYREISINAWGEANEQLLPADPEQNSKSMKTTWVGSAVGLGVGQMIGLAAGSLLGPIGALGGAAAGGAAGAVVGLALSDRDHDKYEAFLKNGGVVLSVECEGTPEKDRAEEILRDTQIAELKVTTPGGSPMEGS